MLINHRRGAYLSEWPSPAAKAGAVILSAVGIRVSSWTYIAHIPQKECCQPSSRGALSPPSQASGNSGPSLCTFRDWQRTGRQVYRAAVLLQGLGIKTMQLKHLSSLKRCFYAFRRRVTHAATLVVPFARMRGMHDVACLTAKKPSNLPQSHVVPCRPDSVTCVY